MSKPTKKKQEAEQFWTVFYSHKHGTDSWTVVATDAASALSDAIAKVNEEMPEHPFDADRENLDVSPFRPPRGYKLVKNADADDFCCGYSR